VIGSRLNKVQGFWTVRGANAILVLRCCQAKRPFSRITGRPVGQPALNFYVAHLRHAYLYAKKPCGG